MIDAIKKFAMFIMAMLLIIAVLAALSFSKQLSEAQDKLAKSQKQSAQLQTQSTQLTDAITKLQTQVAEQAAALGQELPGFATPKVAHSPVEYHTREALLGSGLVLEIKNTAPHILPVTITITNPVTKQQQNFNRILDSGCLAQLGPEQGVKVTPGDKISIKSTGYDTIQYTIGQ